MPATPTTTTTARHRTTIALTGTTFRTSAQLDHTGALTLAWAGHWLTAAGGAKVPASGVLRRALAVYAQHLQRINGSSSAAGQPHGDPAAHEFATVRRTCLASPGDPEDQRAAWARLEAAPAGVTPPALSDVLHGPGHANRTQALTDAAEALAVQCMKRGHRGRG